MQGLLQHIQTLVALTVLILAAIWDVKNRRIPNAVTLPAILLGLILTAAFDLKAIPLTFIALILLFFFGALNLMGQGDVKLIMTLTAICSLSVALLSTGIAAILLVAIQLLLHPNETVRNIKNSFGVLFTMDFKRIDNKGRSVPFAPYILAGFVCLTLCRLILR